MTDATLDDVVLLETGVRVSVVEISGITVEAETPGEVAGPAVAATIRFENESGEPLDLGGAIGLAPRCRRQRRRPHDVLAGGTDDREAWNDGEGAEGTYVFRIPEDTRNEITLTVGYAAGAPIVVFHGSAT